MLPETDRSGRFVVHRGARYSVVCAVKTNGKSPAREFLEDLEAHDKGKLRQFAVLFQRIGQTGWIANKQHFRHEEGPIWTFKRYQHRLACFRDGDCFVLTHGFPKKQDKWLKSDLQTAVNIMNEDKARVQRMREKGNRK